MVRPLNETPGYTPANQTVSANTGPAVGGYRDRSSDQPQEVDPSNPAELIQPVGQVTSFRDTEAETVDATEPTSQVSQASELSPSTPEDDPYDGLVSTFSSVLQMIANGGEQKVEPDIQEAVRMEDVNNEKVGPQTMNVANLPELSTYKSVLTEMAQPQQEPAPKKMEKKRERPEEAAKAIAAIKPAAVPAFKGGEVVDQSGKFGGNWNFGTMKANSLVVHHTAGRGTVEGVVQTFKERGFPAHFVIDREGKTHQILGIDQRGRHTKNSKVNDVTNANSWGVEIIAKDDSDVTPKQVQAAVQLTKMLHEQHGMPMNRVFGHGEINTHKQQTEGASVVSVLRQGA